MYRIAFLIIGLSALCLQAHAEEAITILEESPTSIEIDTITDAKIEAKTPPPSNTTDASPVVIITDQPVGASMQEALAAPEDPFVAGEAYKEGKDLNTEDSESPDEADEDGEEDSDDEDGDDDTADGEE